VGRIGRIEVIGRVGTVITGSPGGAVVVVVAGSVVVVVVGASVVVVVGASVVVVVGASVVVVVSGGGGGSVVTVTWVVVVVVVPVGRGFLGGLAGGGNTAGGGAAVVVDVEVEPGVEAGVDVPVVVTSVGTNGSEMLKGAVATAGVAALDFVFLLEILDTGSALTVVGVVDVGGTSTGFGAAVVVVVLGLAFACFDVGMVFDAAAPPTNGAGPWRWETK
jgi:hypothetical protein